MEIFRYKSDFYPKQNWNMCSKTQNRNKNNNYYRSSPSCTKIWCQDENLLARSIYKIIFL